MLTKNCLGSFTTIDLVDPSFSDSVLIFGTLARRLKAMWSKRFKKLVFFTVKSSRIEWTGDWFFGKSKKKSWVISQNLITADHPPQFLNYLSLPFHLSHGQPNQTNQPTAANGVHMANPRIHWWKQRPEPMKQKTSGTLAALLQTKKRSR